MLLLLLTDARRVDSDRDNDDDDGYVADHQEEGMRLPMLVRRPAFGIIPLTKCHYSIYIVHSEVAFEVF